MKKTVRLFLLMLASLMLLVCFAACGKDDNIYLIYEGAKLSTIDGEVTTLKTAAQEGEVFYLITPTETVRNNPNNNTKEKFLGWKSDEGNGRVYMPNETLAIGQTTVTLTAIWKQAYTFSFDGGDGTTGTGPQVCYYAAGEIFELPQNATMQKAGFRFDGWTNGTANFEAGASFTVSTADVVFSAVWTRVYSITFESGASEGQIVNGSAPIVSARENNQSVTLPQNSFVIAGGYDFVCWVDKADGKEYDAGEIFVIKGIDVCFKAKWKKSDIASDENFTYLSVDIGEASGYSIAKSTTAELKGNLTLPSSYQGLPILAIADNGFSRCNITNVEIPSSILKIGKQAFYCCANLTTVVLGTAESISSLREICSQAFESCSNLKIFGGANFVDGVFDAPSVTTVREAAFFDCAFKTIKISANTSIIEDKAFAQNTFLTDFAVDASNVKFAGTQMLVSGDRILAYACANTATTVSTDNATEIAPFAFSYAKKLTSVTFGERLETIGAQAFERCTNITKFVQSIDAQRKLETIGYSAFLGCTSLSAFDFGKTVKNIDINAFDGCTSLSQFTCSAENPDFAVDQNNDALYNKNITKLLIVAKGKQGTVFYLPNSVNTIGAYAFRSMGITMLSTNDLSLLTTIENHAFESCTKLSGFGVRFWQNIVSIGDHAFENCRSLKVVNFGEELNHIGEYAFNFCTGEEFAVSFDENCPLTQISVCAFAESSLKVIALPKNVVNIDKQAFNGSALVNINLSNVTTIGQQAFSVCDSLKSVKLPASLISLAVDAFAKCKSVEKVEVELENTMFKSIDGNLYSKDGKKLLLVAVANTQNVDFVLLAVVEEIGENAFLQADNLISFATEEGSALKKIGANAFWSCGYLKNVLFPSGLKEIGEAAFYDCTQLTNVTFEGEQQLSNIQAKAFGNCIRLKLVLNGTNLPEIDEEAFYLSTQAQESNLRPKIFVDSDMLTEAKQKWSFISPYLNAIEE